MDVWVGIVWVRVLCRARVCVVYFDQGTGALHAV